MLWGGHYLQLFTVRSRACVSEWGKRDAVIRAVTSKRRILKIPFHGFYAKTDGAYYLEISPDGKYVAICLSASAWNCGVIFHARDAGSIFRKEHHAIYWQDDHSFSRLTWPLNLPPCSASVTGIWTDDDFDRSHNRYIAGNYGFTDHSFPIDIKTGSRGGLFTFDKWKCVEWWPTRDRFLLVTDHGLYPSRFDGGNLYDAYSDDLLPPIIPHPLPESALFPD